MANSKKRTRFRQIQLHRQASKLKLKSKLGSTRETDRPRKAPAMKPTGKPINNCRQHRRGQYQRQHYHHYLRNIPYNTNRIHFKPIRQAERARIVIDNQYEKLCCSKAHYSTLILITSRHKQVIFTRMLLTFLLKLSMVTSAFYTTVSFADSHTTTTTTSSQFPARTKLHERIHMIKLSPFVHFVDNQRPTTHHPQPPSHKLNQIQYQYQHQNQNQNFNPNPNSNPNQIQIQNPIQIQHNTHNKLQLPTSANYNQRIRQLSSSLILPHMQSDRPLASGKSSMQQPPRRTKATRTTSTRQQRQIGADRRASSGGNQFAKEAPTTSSSSSSQQSPVGEDAKLLVCYYTTRESIENLQRDGRDYLIPTETLVKLQQHATTSGSGQASRFAASLSQATELQYEPFVVANGRLGPNLNPNLNFNPNSIQSLQSQWQSPNGFAANGSKQTPAYSLIGEFEDNASMSATNGLIVTARPNEPTTTSASVTPAVASSSIFGSQYNGNNRNNLIIANDNAGGGQRNNGFKFERADSSPTSLLLLPPRQSQVQTQAHNQNQNQNQNQNLQQQQQPHIHQPQYPHPHPNSHAHSQQLQLPQAQLVFSPSTLSRAFVVANDNKATSTNDNNSSSFFGEPQNVFNQQTQQQQQQLQQTTATASATATATTATILNPAASQQATQASGMTNLASSPANLLLQNSNIHSQLQRNSPSQSTVAFPSTVALRLSQPQPQHHPHPQQPQHHHQYKSQQQQLLIASDARASPDQQPDPSKPLASSSGQANGKVNLNPGSSHAQLSPTSNSALTSALVSSPLSTMFDVFGAASQYLMRFKPSSFISQSVSPLAPIQALNIVDHHGLQQSSNGQNIIQGQQADNSSSLFGSLAQFPLSFSSNLISSSNNHKIISTTTSGAQNSSQGILSRFVSLPSQHRNQRREDVCGRTIQTPERRIIGGEGAKYGEFPYQVHIKIAKHQCGGALVDKQSIVTAAHCVYHFITRAPVSKLQIVIGAYDIEDEQYQELAPQYFKVNKVKLHPNFRFSASHPDRYDVAILKLDKPVKYTDNVLPVCLPGKDIKFENMIGTVTGFGKTDPSLSNRYGTRLLQKVDVPIIENNECERWHRTRGIDLKIFPEMMCAGYEDGLKDACVGDSGGPLVVKSPIGSNGGFRWTLAGITSAGFGCAQSRQPGIYHRVSHTVGWILDNLE